MANNTSPKFFWFKLFSFIIGLGLGIGYCGYKHAKTPPFVTLSQIVGEREQINIRLSGVETRLSDVERKISSGKRLPKEGINK